MAERDEKAWEWVGKSELGYQIWEKKYRNNNESFDEWIERVSGGNEDVAALIRAKKFLFGGRILAGRGVKQQDRRITYSNCFIGDTEILTDQGIKKLKDIAGETVNVFARGSWRNAEIVSFGVQPICNLTVKRCKAKKTFAVTPDHIWFVRNSSGKFKEVATKDLKCGDKLPTDLMKCYRKYKPSPFGVAHGFFTGDGDHAGESRRVNFCGDKSEMIQYFMPDTVGCSDDVITICDIPKHMWEYPSLDETPSYLYGWLAGYFAADGSIDERGCMTIASTKYEDLRFVKDVLCVLGIPSCDIRYQDRANEFTGNKIERIYILSLMRKYFNESFFVRSKHRERFVAANEHEDRNNDWTVECVSEVIGEEQVFCAVEPETNSFCLDGNILTHNCYVVSPPEDNIESIFETAKKLARTYSYGGGCGTDLGKLAPRGAKVHNAAKETSGAVSFMDLYSLVTGLIGQGGRRGALMLSMPVNHPDIEEFIGVKSDLNRVTKANISVRITDDFMRAVKEDKPYELTFTREETGETISKTVQAKELFHKMAEMNWNMAEPGMLFWDAIERDNYLNSNPDFHFAGTNPCAEEPLPSGGSCLLSSINLSEYVVNGKFEFWSFANDVQIVTRAMNDVLDEGLPLHPLQEQRDSVRDWRQIGIGVMGLGDMLIKVGIKYGSEESIGLCSDIAAALANAAAKESAIEAFNNGPYPKCDTRLLCESTMFNRLNQDTRKQIICCGGMRNSQLLTCAPTGSLSTMLGISGGIEPIFANYYTRKTESLNGEDTYYKVYTPIVQQYMDRNGITDEKDLPDYFITAPEIDPICRVRMQAAWQKYIDASISSTVNLPEEATVETIENIYMSAWENGLKGITVYRANCARTGILTKGDGQKKESDGEPVSDEEVKRVKIERGIVEDVPDGLVYCKYKLKTGCGSLYLFVGVDEVENKIYDVFTEVGHNGCVINTRAVSRLISTCIRGGIPIDYVIEQLTRAGVCPSWQLAKGKGEKMSAGFSCASAIAAVLRELQARLREYDVDEDDAEEQHVSHVEDDHMDVCPECGKRSLAHEGGCVSCMNCGYSRCS